MQFSNFNIKENKRRIIYPNDLYTCCIKKYYKIIITIIHNNNADKNIKNT